MRFFGRQEPRIETRQTIQSMNTGKTSSNSLHPPVMPGVSRVERVGGFFYPHIMSTRISRAAWSTKISDPQAKLVLLKLADCADEKGVCWPFVSTIAAETELAERTVRRKLDLLEEAGLIVRDRVKNGVTYTVTIPSKGVTVTGQGVSQWHPLNGSGGVTVTAPDQNGGCHSDRAGVSQCPVGGVTVSVTIKEEPPRTTIEPPEDEEGNPPQRQSTNGTSEIGEPSPRFAEVMAFGKSQPMPISEECIEGFFDEMEALQWTYKGVPCRTKAAWHGRFRRWATNWHNNATGKGPKR